jgi:acetyl esterase/lipase
MSDKQTVNYVKAGGRNLKLDVFRPEIAASTHTAVILLHGGAWRMGDKSMMEVFGKELARLGFVALAPEYRLLDESPWPSQIEDVKASIRWTRENAASLAIHPDKIAVQGFSAGGHLALMAGGTPNFPGFIGKGGNKNISDGIAAVVAFFPPIEFRIDPPSADFIRASDLLGASPTRDEAQKASPINYVSQDYPPTFLLHGTADKMVPCTTSQKMFNALHEKGVAVELHLYPHHTHEFVRLPSMLCTVQSEIALFLKRFVVDPEKYAAENITLNMFASLEL